jgi:hypothetical protein
MSRLETIKNVGLGLGIVAVCAGNLLYTRHVENEAAQSVKDANSEISHSNKRITKGQEIETQDVIALKDADGKLAVNVAALDETVKGFDFAGIAQDVRDLKLPGATETVEDMIDGVQADFETNKTYTGRTALKPNQLKYLTETYAQKVVDGAETANLISDLKTDYEAFMTRNNTYADLVAELNGTKYTVCENDCDLTDVNELDTKIEGLMVEANVYACRADQKLDQPVAEEAKTSEYVTKTKEQRDACRNNPAAKTTTTAPAAVGVQKPAAQKLQTYIPPSKTEIFQ